MKHHVLATSHELPSSRAQFNAMSFVYFVFCNASLQDGYILHNVDHKTYILPGVTIDIVHPSSITQNYCLVHLSPDSLYLV